MIKYEKIESENIICQVHAAYQIIKINCFFGVPVSFTINLEFFVKYINSSSN